MSDETCHCGGTIHEVDYHWVCDQCGLKVQTYQQAVRRVGDEWERALNTFADALVRAIERMRERIHD